MAYANGIPFLLTASTMAVLLKEYGLTYTSIGLFSLVHLPATVKFLWAPVLDSVRLPVLGKLLGQRRSWLFLMQILAFAGVWGMGSFNPTTHLSEFIFCVFLITTATASQHVLLMAYQVQTLESRNWGIGESASVFGFRMALLTSGAGALYLSQFFDWESVYHILSIFLFFGIFVVLWMPDINEENGLISRATPSFFKRMQEWWKTAVVGAWSDFSSSQPWKAVLVFMILYRFGDNILSSMPTLFYLDIGFDKGEIASVVKLFGMISMVVGSFLGGALIRTWGYKRTLLVAGSIHACSTLAYVVQFYAGHSIEVLYGTVAFEHFTSGMALTAFFAYQLTCSSRRYAATQIALITSITALGRTVISSFSGMLVDTWGWEIFFLIAFLSAIPGLLWIQKLTFRVR